MSTAHTPGPWSNREGSIVADTREQACCGQPCVGAEYMGQQEMICCGNPEVDGDEEDIIATVKYERDIPLVIAAPDMLAVLEHIRRCVRFDPASGQAFVQIHEGSATMADIDAAIAKATGGALPAFYGSTDRGDA